jgi:hypothetical protein
VKNGSKNLPAFIIAPQTITKANYKLLFTQGYLKKSKVCVGIYAKYCSRRCGGGRLDAAPQHFIGELPLDDD